MGQVRRRRADRERVENLENVDCPLPGKWRIAATPRPKECAPNETGLLNVQSRRVEYAERDSNNFNK